MSGTKIATAIVRGVIRAQKQATRENARREREFIREQKKLEREIIRLENEEAKEKIRLSKEQLKTYNNIVKKEWDKGKIDCENRFKNRNDLRLTFIK
tara:strand:- start:1736 stop:2026 length:291 start_codon:yes stop_codon:yes gene_type:complete